MKQKELSGRKVRRTLKNLIEKIPFKLRILGVVSVICLLFIGLLSMIQQQMQKNLYDQQMAKRWSGEGGVSQISVFYTEGAVEDSLSFQGTAQSIENALKQASIVNEKEHARLWIDAFSRSGEIILSTQRAEVEINALGVGGEFFQFHPQKMVTGATFHADSMMQDGIVIDKETAWQLFGSFDVSGMQVMIGSVPHYITGVIERPTGRLAEAAGLDHSICFLSMESLENYGTVRGGYTYEIVLPNPIKGFAYSAVQTAVGMENDNVILVENNKRYQFLSLINVIRQFGVRSMSFKEIVYPYWENIARGYEDIFAMCLLVKIILLMAPVMFVIAGIMYIWNKKTWTFTMGITRIQDKIYESGSRRVQKKQRKKGGEKK